MSSIFEDIQKGKIYNGKVFVKESKHEKKETPKQEIAEHRANPYKVEPYYEGGLRLETYGHNPIRGFSRAVARKTPLVVRDVVKVGKRTVVPAIKQGGRQIIKAGLKIGKANFESARKRRLQGFNIYW